MSAIAPPKTATLPLSEVFGPVWQGEGPHAGRFCSFVRLGLCNLSCEWCDTPYTWDTSRFDVAAECPETPAEAITAQLIDHRTRMVVLSGGEPLMHQRKDAFTELLTLRREWHIETNGTITPTEATIAAVDHFTVSPKVITHDPERKRLKMRSLGVFAELAASFSHDCIFKFVAATADDVDKVAALAEQLDLDPSVVWLMPEGITPTAVLEHARAIADRTLAHGFNLTLRQQTLMYGEERGR